MGTYVDLWYSVFSRGWVLVGLFSISNSTDFTPVYIPFGELSGIAL